MSGGAVRSHNNRRQSRHNNASPYSRPGPAAAKRSSGWSISGILNNIFHPLRSLSSQPSQPEGQEPSNNSAAERLVALGEQMDTRPPAHNPGTEAMEDVVDQPAVEVQNGFGQPHASSSQTRSPLQSTTDDQRISPRSDESRVSSSSVSLKKVQEFLDEKGGRPLNQIEFAGLVSLLQKSVEGEQSATRWDTLMDKSTDEDDNQEPFRFSKSPSTPARGTTPAINFLAPSTSEQMVAAAGTAAQNGRKTLAKNPMGVYRWQGSGSARPRNRYQSPGFGSMASRPSIKLTPEKPKTDTKRRRVGEDATTSSPQRTAKVNSHTPPSTTVANDRAANGKVNGTSNAATPPRVRTSGITKPTTPAIPSPLRQTWCQSDSPPQTSAFQPASKPTRAASFMTELIKEVTPPKKPDFANPYETISPLAKPAPRKQPVRKTRSSAKADAEKQKEKEKEKEPELTPQAIIEATVPKASTS
ncbi:hypothetical protein BD413DRAFT_635148 [Trametes elegans]|nr:hypothetical protein BD413DRAFT_635148 [Trametes elegans]